MPVRYDDAARPMPSVAAQESPREDDPQVRRDQRLGNWAMAGLAAFLLGAAVVGMSGGVPRQDELAPSLGSTAVPTSLPTGRAAQDAGARNDVAGVPTGFPQTVAGAVSAMMTYNNAAGAAMFRAPQERAQIGHRIYTDEGYAASGLTDEAATETRERLGVNEAGVAVREDGSLDLARTAFAACAYEFGAYRVTSLGGSGSRSPGPGEPAFIPHQVVATTWSPCLSGVGGAHDHADIGIRWVEQTSILRWDGADWRIESTVSPDDPAPVPADPIDVAVTFEERARLLGKGWTLPADATEELSPAFWATGTR